MQASGFISTMTNQAMPDAIFVPIDLEASLGKIEDGMEEEVLDMDCDHLNHAPRTSEKHPGVTMDLSKEYHFIAPYPYSQTERELQERERLTQQVGYNWTGEKAAPFSISFDQVPNDEDCDDFSLTSREAGSLADECFSLDQDPASFWDEGDEIPVTAEGRSQPPPSSISVGSMNESSLRL